MQLAPAPRPTHHPAVAQPFAPIEGPFDPARDLEVLADGDLPNELTGPLVEIETSAGEELGPDLYAAPARGERVHRVTGTALEDALRAAQHVAGEALAIVQSNDGASRYLVPLGIWSPVDESQLSFADVGGTPHDDGADDHVRVSPRQDVDVQAIVFDGGTRWVDWSGQQKPGASASDVLARYGDILEAAGAWRTDASNPRQLAVRFLDNASGQFADRLLRDSIDGVELVLQTRSGKPLPKGSDRYANESEALPSYFWKRELPGVVGASIGAGAVSIPSVTYTDTERAAQLLRAAVDVERPLDGAREWRIEARR